jgi:microcystin-dependent protein
MPFDSSGTFNRVRNWVSDAAAGIKIRADYHDDEDNGFAAGLSQCITKDGKTQPTANLPMNTKRLVNLGDPVAATDSVNKQYVDNAILAAQTALALPPGVMMPYTKSGSTPTGWLYCNGAAISRAAYAPLFALIGTTFGIGDGATTFNLPDMRGRFPRGWNDDATLDPTRVFGSTQTDDFEAHTHTASTGTESADHTHAVIGSTGGDIGSHTHTTYADNSYYTVNAGVSQGVPKYQSGTPTGAESASHTHNISFTSGGRSVAHTHAVTVNAVGGAETRPHNVALCWIIKT